MKKKDLKDITFLLLVRIDSIDRLENLKMVVDSLISYFHTNITIWEVSSYKNGLIKQILHKKVQYNFIEDIDPIFHRTKYYNMMVEITNTPYFAIWDADIVVDRVAILQCADSLRTTKSDISYPYNGICYDVSFPLRKIFLKERKVKFLFENIEKMNLLYDNTLVGGCIIVNKEKYLDCGKENTRHYGWGNEDYDRYYRFLILGLKIFRTNNCLFHLTHPRNINGQFNTYYNKIISMYEIDQITSSSIEDLFEKIKLKE